VGPALLQIPDRAQADLRQVSEFLLSQPGGAAADAYQRADVRAPVLPPGSWPTCHSAALGGRPGAVVIARHACSFRKTRLNQAFTRTDLLSSMPVA
jgi:hypothetical protein